MDPKLTQNSDFVRQMSARLRAESPLFAPDAPEMSPRLIPTPVPRRPREVQPAEPEFPQGGPLSSVMRPIAERVARDRREQAERLAAQECEAAEMEVRAAEARVARYAGQFDPVVAEVIEEQFVAARAMFAEARAEGNEELLMKARSLLSEVDDFLRDDAGRTPEL